MAHGFRFDIESCGKYGYIVEDVAAGFIVTTSSNFCFLEGFITNPACGPKARNAAINEIRDGLLKLGKHWGCKSAYVASLLPSINKRCAKSCFVCLGKNFTFWVKKL
jgi:hypothetical protein